MIVMSPFSEINELYLSIILSCHIINQSSSSYQAALLALIQRAGHPPSFSILLAFVLVKINLLSVTLGMIQLFRRRSSKEIGHIPW